MNPLRLVFGDRDQRDRERDDPEEDAVPRVEFVAYAEDCTLSGRIALAAERLSDLLNEHESFELADVRVTPLDGSPPFQLETLGITRDELFLVHASGPRGNADRRHRTLPHAIALGAPPYEISGVLHSLPGGDPVASFRRRRPMVALTDAVVRYTVAGLTQEAHAETVIVNCDLVEWIEDRDPKVIAEREAANAAQDPAPSLRPTIRTEPIVFDDRLPVRPGTIGRAGMTRPTRRPIWPSPRPAAGGPRSASTTSARGSRPSTSRVRPSSS